MRSPEPPRSRRPLLGAAALLAAILLAGAPSLAETPAPIDLSGARVLASPGLPEGLRSFLPGSGATEPLRWPLPSGPVVVVGLPDVDPVAREIADVFGMLPEDGDLHGGWSLAAWSDRGRPLVLLMGADAAALYAARFEMETVTTTRGQTSAEPPEAALKEGRPLAAGSVRVAPGRRAWRPPFRTRAFVSGPGPCDVCSLAAGAYANRAWIEARSAGDDLARTAARLRAVGVEPVLRTTRPDESDHARLLALQKAGGIRRFAVEVSDWPADLVLVATVAAALRPGGLDEVVVYGGPTLRPADLRMIPEATFAWSGPPTPVSVSASEAVEARRRSGIPMVFLETWMAGPRASRLVSTPTGRDPRLGDVVDGIVVLGGEAAAPLVERAWDPDARPEEPIDVLRPLVSLHPESPAVMLKRAAKGWTGAGDFAPRLEAVAESLPEEDVHLVPTVPDSVAVDGARNERAWTHAVKFRLGAVDVYAVADGRRLYLSADPSASSLRDLLVADEDGRGTAFPFPAAPEVALDRFALGGDAYPTRVFRLHLDGARRPAAVLVVGR